MVNNSSGFAGLFRPRGACLLCGRPASKRSALCTPCSNLLSKQKLDSNRCCACCALPLAAAGNNPASIQFLCGQCQRHRPAFERCHAAVSYNRVSARLVNNLKHRLQLAALSPIAGAMLDSLQHHPLDSLQYLLPVPLHPRRLAHRGFNQSLEIARLLGSALGIPVANAALRLRDDPSQQVLDRETRLRNLRNAFSICQPLPGARIAIVDDVVTTTATANCLARLALDAGAVGVEVWCFARTPAPGTPHTATVT